ncbi:hypothetical protein KR100_09295 [Synechococcus sp. KORDI-100]|nr:hypothetical protein KR100_09295 [Synechococcus sp. KORDI-100]
MVQVGAPLQSYRGIVERGASTILKEDRHSRV